MRIFWKIVRRITVFKIKLRKKYSWNAEKSFLQLLKLLLYRKLRYGFARNRMVWAMKSIIWPFKVKYLWKIRNYRNFEMRYENVSGGYQFTGFDCTHPLMDKTWRDLDMSIISRYYDHPEETPYRKNGWMIRMSGVEVPSEVYGYISGFFPQRVDPISELWGFGLYLRYEFKELGKARKDFVLILELIHWFSEHYEWWMEQETTRGGGFWCEELFGEQRGRQITWVDKLKETWGEYEYE